MPRFYFDTDDGSGGSHDDAGFELADLTAARREAVDALPDIAQEIQPDDLHRVFAVLVRDAAGRPVIRAQLTLSVEVLTEMERT